MSFWWLLYWVLWALSGLLGWGWTNYLNYGPHPKPADHVRWAALPASMGLGPVYLLLSVLLASDLASDLPRGRRWGLRFR